MNNRARSERSPCPGNMELNSRSVYFRGVHATWRLDYRFKWFVMKKILRGKVFLRLVNPKTHGRQINKVGICFATDGKTLDVQTEVDTSGISY